VPPDISGVGLGCVKPAPVGTRCHPLKLTFQAER
jgi:hypothetical protein